MTAVSLRLVLFMLVAAAIGFAGACIAQTGQPAPQVQTAPAAPLAAPSNAPPPVAGGEVNNTISAWTEALSRIEKGLANEGIRYRALDFYRKELDEIRALAAKFIGETKPKLEAAQAQIDSLGAPPGENQPPEPEAVAKQRESMTANWAALSAALKSAEATNIKASQLTATVQDIRRENFTKRLFERVPGLFSLAIWERVPQETGAAFVRGFNTVKDWWRALESRWDVIQVVILSIALWIALFYVTRRGIAHLRKWTQIAAPPFWKRASSAAGVIFLQALPTIGTCAFLYFALSLNGLLPAHIDRLLYAAIAAAIIINAVNALITTILAPGHPEWRIIPTSDDAAHRIRWLVLALAGVNALDVFMGTLNDVTASPFAVTLAQGFLACLAFAGLVIASLRTRGDALPIEGAPQLSWMKRLRIPLWVFAFLIIITAGLGYVALSRFIATQVIVTGTILAVLYLLLIWVDAFGQSIKDETAPAGHWLKSAAGIDERRREQFALPLTLLLKLGVVLASLPLIMLQWGFDWQDVSEWFGKLLFGFRIGKTEISLAAIIAAIVVFVLGYAAAKLFQSWLDKQVLAPSGLAGGTRDSIRTGVGYLGVFAAGLVAFSYAGVDLSNLAIVAGAFSVGIGFGLQSIINNFVSGLILLAERPIKVGDWVVVGGEEGHVRKISVRSTEIETFDRASVIVPNSYFITETVKNWTFSNNIGRVMIPVGVGYDSDPEQIRDLLLTAAKEHPLVMSDPAPFVLLEDFGASSLDFKLFAYVYNVTGALGIRSDLRMGILKAFREHNVEIPFRQTEITLRGLEWLKDALAGKQPKPH